VKIAPVADVKARFSSYVDECRDQPVLVTKNGRPAAMLVSIPTDPDELERFILAHSPRFRRLLDAADRRIGKGRGLKHGAFWKVASRH
jgi:prevent-host-death family protein